MKRFSIAAMFCVAMLSMNSKVHASALDALVAAAGGPGVITTLEDDDWEELVKAGGTISNPGTAPKTIEVGDFFVGMLRISQIVDGADFVDNGGTAFSAFFAIKIDTINATGTVVTATNLTDDEWDDIGLNAIGFTREEEATIAIVYDDPTNVQPELEGDGSVVDDLTNVGVPGPPATDSGPNGTRLWEFGIGPDSFWTVTTPGGLLLPASGSGAFAPFNAGLDLTHTYAAGAIIVFHPIPNSELGPSAPPGDSQLLITGLGLGPDFGRDSDFDLASDSDLQVSVSVIPEPGSMILLGMGAAGMFGARFRRRRTTRPQQQAV